MGQYGIGVLRIRGHGEGSLFQPIRKDNRNRLSEKQRWLGSFSKRRKEITGLIHRPQWEFLLSSYILERVA